MRVWRTSVGGPLIALAAAACGGPSRGGEGAEVIAVGRVPETRTLDASTPAPIVEPPDTGDPLVDVLAAIRTVSPTEHVMTRHGLELLLENKGRLFATARIVPEVENGAPVGIRLYGVRAGTVLHALGFLNADRLQSVAGISVVSPEGALEVYGKLRDLSTFEVDILRNGAPMSLLFRLE